MKCNECVSDFFSIFSIFSCFQKNSTRRTFFTFHREKLSSVCVVSAHIIIIKSR